MGVKMHLAMIEGLGDETASTASDKQFRFCYSPAFLDDKATVDPDSLYKTGLMMWPSQLSQDWDAFDSRVSMGSQEFRFSGTSELKSLLYTQNHTSVAKLSTDISSTDTTVVLTAGTLANKTIFLEREAIKLGSVSGVGPYTYSGCLRGRLGTIAIAHGSEARDDSSVYTSCNILEGRVVRLVEVDLDASSAYSTETTLWTYVIRNITSPDGGGTISVQTDSLLASIFQKKIYEENIFKAKVVGSSSRGDVDSEEIYAMYIRAEEEGELGLPPQNFMPAGGAQPASTSTTGSFLGLIGDKFLYKFTYNANDYGQGKQFHPSNFAPRLETESIGEGPRPEGHQDLGNVQVREIFSSITGSPSNMNTPGTNTLPLSQNPGELILQILTTTPNNNISGTNGSYDTGVNAIAGGMRYDLVDEAQILSWADELGDGYEQESFYIGLDEKPVTVGSVIDSIASVFQSSLVQLKSGKIGMARFKDVPRYGEATQVTTSNILNIGDLAQDRRIFDQLDRINIEYRIDPGEPPSTVNTSDIIKYRRLLNRTHGELKVTAHGLRSHEGVIALAQRMVQRWHEPIPMVFIETNHLEDHSVGDIISITHPNIFDTDGTIGVTSTQMLVVSRAQEFGDEEHYFRYTLMDVSAVYPRLGYIAPTGKVQSYSNTLGVNTIVLEQNIYTDTYANKPNDPLGTGSDRRDIDGFKAGDVIDIVDQYFTPITGSTGIAISSINRATNKIVLASVPTSAPVAGNIIRPSKYANSVQSQKDDWVYVADSSNKLGASSDEGKSYVY